MVPEALADTLPPKTADAAPKTSAVLGLPPAPKVVSTSTKALNGRAFGLNKVLLMATVAHVPR